MSGGADLFRVLSQTETLGVLVADSRPSLVVDRAGNRLLWANAAGAAFFGVTSVEKLTDLRFATSSPFARRITTLEGQVAELRAKMTEDSPDATSLAEVQGELLVAQADLQTRQMLLAQALQSKETARIEANRQVRYLSLSVSPIPPDEPTYPRAFENTLVTMLIMLGIYLMVSMTVSILREQVSS